ncbi:MAG: hypothetical protein ACJAQ1_000290 [Flavobacterium sp.]|jgi:hypothetical protein
MMKSIIYFTKLVVITILTFLVTSCDFDFGGIKGNGIEKTEQRKIAENFDKLEVSRGLEVIVTQGKTTKVEVTSDENLLEYIKTSVSNGTLKITTTESIRSQNDIVIHVTLPNLQEVSSSSGSTITTQNILTGTNLIAKATSGSELDLDLEIENIQAQTSSGSSIKLKGKALNVNHKASSGSEINGFQLVANEATVQASSGSSIEVYASQMLDAKVSSGASVEYQGKPKSIKKTKSSGGSIDAM